MNKNIILAAAILALGTVAAYAAPEVTVVVDEPFSATNDPKTTPALNVTGTWNLSTPGDTRVVSLVNWALTLKTETQQMSGVTLYLVNIKGQHLVPSASQEFEATLGLPNTSGSSGETKADKNHKPPGDGDYWILTANINPAGTY